MKKRNIMIVLLLTVGITLFTVIHLIVLPTLAQKEQQYIIDQQDPLTHDVKSVLKYKNKYMGNASNIINLFYTLPLNNIERTYQLYTDEYTIEINYKEVISKIDKLELERALLYNVTIVFSLIENLDEIHFLFRDAVIKVSREDIEKWYGIKLTTITDLEGWMKGMQSLIEDTEYVLKAIDTIFHFKYEYSGFSTEGGNGFNNITSEELVLV